MHRLAPIVIAAALGGCSMFMHSIERPTATVRGVDVQAAGLAGVQGELRLDVMNPNGFGVPLDGIDWQLSINGARALTGTVQLAQTIPARGVAPITTTLRVDARDAMAAAASLAGGGRAYQLDAKLHFSTPVGHLDVAVQQRGTMGSPLGLR